MATTFGFYLSGVIAVGIIFIGYRFLLAPSTAAVAYGVTTSTEPHSQAYLYAKGIRDIASGLFIAILMAYGYGKTGKKLSAIAKCYDPAGATSKERYDWICKYLADAVEEAIIFALEIERVRKSSGSLGFASRIGTSLLERRCSLPFDPLMASASRR